MRDVVTLESELAQSIAEKWECQSLERNTAGSALCAPVAPEVYESYLKGRFAFRTGEPRLDLSKVCIISRMRPIETLRLHHPT